mgnify:CR=1 FL=1
MSPAPENPIRITAYFDFMCPWSYLGRVRLLRAITRAKIKHPHLEWIPFQLYEHHPSHTIQREKIIGHSHLNQVYARLHELAARENIVILHPQYEASSRRALTGFLYAQKKGTGEKYLDEMFEQAFEHTSNIASIPLLRRVAIKLGFPIDEFLAFVENKENQHHIHVLTEQAKHEGVRGVPTYLMNHLPVTGALEVNDLVNILQTLRKHMLPAYVIEKNAAATSKPKKRLRKIAAQKKPPNKKPKTKPKKR